jgi:hypothetical protein
MALSLGKWSCPFRPWRPADGRIFDFFSFDSETTEINDDRPDLVPAYVLGAACDGCRGVFISRDNLLQFFKAHTDVPVVFHNAAFDLKVIDVMVRPTVDIYEAVDKNLVWDTMVFTRLYSLATAGHTARGDCGLADSCRAHLGIDLDKHQADTKGKTVRTNFGEFLGKPPSSIPTEYLNYLAHDVIVTWHLFLELNRRIKELLQNANAVYGFVSPEWLKHVTSRFGPLTHHIQLKASILIEVLRSNGIGVDPNRREEKARKVQEALDSCKERMRRRGFLVDEPGSDKALQSILTELKRRSPALELKTTATGKWSTTEEDLAELADADGFFADYRTYKAAEKLLSSYLRKMGPARLHPQFGYLLETGRTYCRGFTLQNLPREKDLKDAAATIRGCFVPGEGKVFIDSDYSQIELVVLGYVQQAQFGRRSRLAEMINGGLDVHRLIAAAVLGKHPQEVTKAERDSAKPVSFGRPGGMGPQTLWAIAKGNYGIELTLEQVEQRIQAYHSLCPELDQHLTDEVNGGDVIASQLNLTTNQYCRATGTWHDPTNPFNELPVGWYGWMLLKVLRDPDPKTRHDRAYTPAEIDFLWERAQQLPVKLKPQVQARLQNRHPDQELWEAVRNWAGRRAVFTVTGRLRAN